MRLEHALKDYSVMLNKDKFTNREATLGSSEVYTCIRKLVYMKHSFKPDPNYINSHGAADRGNMIEAHLVDALEHTLPVGLALLIAGQKQVTFTNGFLSSTPDGLLLNESNESKEWHGIEIEPMESILVEFKSIDPRVNLKGQAKVQHIGQVQIQMGLVSLCTDEKPKAAVIHYVNASFIDEVESFVIEPDPAIFEYARQRAIKVFTTKNPEDVIPDQGGLDGSDCKYCAYVNQCSMAIHDNVPEIFARDLTVTQDKELYILCENANDANQMIKGAKLAENEAKAKIKTYLKDLDARGVKQDWGSITWSRVKGRKSLDKERLEDEFNIDLNDYQKEGIPGDSLTIKLV